MMDCPLTNQGSYTFTELARNVQKIQPIKSQYITLSTNHMRAFRVVNDPETGFKDRSVGRVV